MKQFYSNGKLLLTGEYLVLDGAKALAIPTVYGQDLIVAEIPAPQLIWSSYTNGGEIWFEAIFDLPTLKLTSSSLISETETNAEFVAETLQNILREAKQLNPNFLKEKKGFTVKTNLTFDRKWGLGSSSTLLNNIANWAKIDAFQLLWNAFSGSGYDIACAQHKSAILYQLVQHKPIVQKVKFEPSFSENLFFVYLNTKKNSRDGIASYRKNLKNKTLEITEVNTISNEFIAEKTLKGFEKLIFEHERIIGSVLKQTPIKEMLFSDYAGEVKSLGAWGGDFVLATGNKNSPKYFIEKGFTTVIPYKKMAL